MSNYFIGIMIILLSGFVGAMFSKKHKIPVLSTLVAVGGIFTLLPAIHVFLSGESLSQAFFFNPVFGKVNFVIDALSAFFITIISVMGFASCVYSKGYLKHYIEDGKNINAHMVFLSMLIASMLAVVTCQNALMFLVCWEMMSISSFFLVIFENEKKEVVKAGIKYLVFMHVSVLFIILAFALMSIQSGSLDFASFAPILQENVPFANLAFILAFIGFGTKAGFVPFHTWLPDGHPAAPSHVSALMSGVMIKTGIYGILRILSLIVIPSKLIAYTVLIIGLISALYGVLYAVSQNDVKRLLAYSSIENIGIIGIGIGVGMLGLAFAHPVVAVLGFAGALLHILNHSLFKELLFMGAGSVYTKSHTRDIETLGGLIKSMPKTAILFLIASAAICALPPLNGFVSEFMIYFGMFKGLAVHNFFSMITLLFTIAGLALVGTMAALCFSKVFSIIFLGLPRSEKATQVTEDVEASMLVPMTCIAILIFAIGLCPQYVFNFVLKPASAIIGNQVQFAQEPLAIMQTIAWYALGLLVFIALMVMLKLKLTKNKVVMSETWGCGYDNPNNHIQYTASSYVGPFLTMLKPLFKKIFDIEKPRKLFPRSAHFSLHIDDIEEAYVINPLLKGDEWFLSKFEALQSGNIQSYIKYGLIFLLLVIIGSLFIG